MTLVYMLSVLAVLGLNLASALPQGKLVARDGSGSSCTNFTLEQAQQLTGWPKFQQYATDNFGTSDVEISFNLPQYPGYPAIVCLDPTQISVATDGTPDCSQTTGDIGGTTSGTTGTVTLSYQQGFSNIGTWTVTQESSLAVGVSLTATFGVPGDDVSASVSTTATFTNAEAQSFTTSYNNQVTETVTLNTVPGKNCVASLTTNTCNASGSGAADLTLSGWVWFNFQNPLALKSDPSGPKHYFWAFEISLILDADEMSSSMQFSGDMQMTTQANFTSSCS